MAFGENQLAQLEPVTHSRGAAALKRSITVYEQGVIISYAVGARVHDPVTVTISDNLPANWDIGHVAFHPDHHPDDGDAGQRTVRFTVDVEPEEFRIVKVGVRPAPDKDMTELESDQSFSTPQIDAADPADPKHGNGSESTLITGSSGDESPVDDPSVLSSNGGYSAPSPPGAAQDRAGTGEQGTAESGDGGGILPARDPDTDQESLTTAGPFPDVDPEDADSLSELFGGFKGKSSTGDDGKGGVPSGNRSDGAGSADGIESTGESIDSPPVDDQRVGLDPQSPTSDTGPESRPLIPRLIDELDTLSPDHRNRLADQLATLIERRSASQPTESTTVRVQQLESRFEEFDAYIDALGDLLDRDDPAGLLEDLQADLDSLGEAVDALQEEIEAVNVRQDTFEVQIESIISDLEYLTDDQ